VTDAPRPDVDIAGTERAHRRLEAAIAHLTDDDVRRPSLLPDWSIAHVLTHLARNADSHVRMAEGAARGEIVWQYAEGQREREIDEGATRAAAELVVDVARANRAVEAAWHALGDEVWATGRTRVRLGEVGMRLQPLRRWREVEFHLADLGLGDGFTYEDFDPVYVEREESDVSPPRYGGRTDSL
jgi:maleylpyruvate isomerase